MKKTETLVKQLVAIKKKRGSEKLQKLFDAVLKANDTVAIEGSVSSCNPPCGAGDYCSETLGRCVPEIG